jgi:ABC-type nitrate/sulfonate/bicarbonate transport system ATPase subunit
VARALAADPPILILDEAFGALDPITRSAMQKEFRALQQRMRKAVIFVTHDLREALLLADRIALMEEGRLIVDLPVRNFRARGSAGASLHGSVLRFAGKWCRNLARGFKLSRELLTRCSA